MLGLFVTLWGFLVALARSQRDPELRALSVALVGLLAGGSAFYSTVEGWSPVDAVYFSVMTLATVGYGDLAPTTPVSKLFTAVYVIVGAGIFVAFITKVSHRRVRTSS